MKFFKFLAISIAALSMVACNPDNGKENDGPGFITQEFVKVYSDVAATGWTNVAVWAWSLEDQSNYTGGTWPGQVLTEVETVDGVAYYVWNAPKELVDQTIGFIVNNNGEGAQTIDLNVTLKAEGNFVVLTEAGADGKWLATVDGVGADAPEPEPVPAVKLADHTWGICGEITGWADGADIAMAINNGWATADFEVTAAEGSKIKVRANGSWDINYGFAGETIPTDGSEFTATYKGADMVSPQGKYTLSFTIDGEEGTFKLKKN
jgi:hypothetical protein